MAARRIPSARSRCVEVWHDAFAECHQEAREDRVIAIAVDLPRHARAAKRGSAVIAGWPAPVLVPARPPSLRRDSH